MSENGAVNLTPTVLLCAAALLSLLAAGCKPQSADPRRLGDIMEQNAKLRDDISRMEALIRQAGEPEPDLADRIARREQELDASVDEVKKLIDRETEETLRAEELKGRLDSFQHSFTQMQNELNNSPQP